MMKHVRAAVTMMTLSLVACGPQGPAKSAPGGASLTLTIVGATPPRARVVVDDQSVGELDFVVAHGVRVPLGAHRLTVTAPGYLPFDRAFETSGAKISIAVELKPSPD